MEKKSKEEMLEFLRSEESLLAYSNGQELLAVANLFNMNIHIITNEGREGSRSGVGPDPDMSSAAELKGNLVPDLFLYNSKNTNYDLLVKDGSRLDEMGLIGKATKGVFVDDWINVEYKSLKSRRDVVDKCRQ